MTDDLSHYRTCPLCEATCGLELTVRDDAVVRIRGDRDDVFSKGFICPKGSVLHRLHEDPDRLRKPQIRRGDPDDGDAWDEVEWDDAFAYIEERLVPLLATHGSASAALYLGNPGVHNHAALITAPLLMHALGTRSLYTASTVDQMPKHVSSGFLFGSPNTIPVPDIDRTDLLVMLGANPVESNGSLATAPDFPGRLAALKDRGGRLVVIDPMRTKTADMADQHLAIRPGTDAHLLLALLHVVLADPGPYLGHLDGHVSGIDELLAAVAPFPPEAVGPLCGVDAGTIRGLAADIAHAPSAAVYGRIGTHTVPFGTLASWAVDVLALVTGNLDSPGGNMFPLPAHGAPESTAPGGRGWVTGRWHSRVAGYPEVKSEFPVVALADEITTPGDNRTRVLVTVGGNPARSTPNSERLEAALAELDFMVSIDLYRNETTRFADVILPPPSPLERSHYDAAFYGLAVRNVANFSDTLFEADGPSEEQIVARLASVLTASGASADETLDFVLEMEVGKEVARTTSPIAGHEPAEIIAQLSGETVPDKLIDLRLRVGPYGDGFGAEPGGVSIDALRQAEHGIDWGPLAARLPNALRTASGTIELLVEPIVTDLGRLETTLTDPEWTGSDGLRLIGRRTLRSNNSWMHNVRQLVKGKPRCTLQIHPDDAALRDLADGADAVVTSRVGRLTAAVEITDRVARGVVSLPHGWGHGAPGTAMPVAAAHAGVNANTLTDHTAIDPLSGNAVLNGVPVEVVALAMS
jgi:anaerobic selenocysteine-containing dehydrogenase